MKGLHGKVALVTGGASGIGAAACRQFAAAGVRVVIGDIDADRAHALAAEIGAASAWPFRFDAADTEQIRQLVEQGAAHFGRLDFLFNNAALVSAEVVQRDTDPVGIDFENWDRVLAVNARGYLAGCKYAIPHLLAAGGGAIVMTGSGAGLAGDLAHVAYAASKAAIMSLSRSVATVYGRQGIRCNVINPGPIVTERGRRTMAPAVREVLQRHTLALRLGEPDDVAAMVLHLCSDAGAFITGQAISVDGGMQAHMPYVADFNSGKAHWT